MVLTSNTCIDGPELGEGVVAQLEGTIYKPGFGVAEELKLFFSDKDKMASTVDSYICLKEGIRNVILFQTKIQVHWVFGPVICRGQLQLVPITLVLKGWDMVHQVSQGRPMKMKRG